MQLSKSKIKFFIFFSQLQYNCKSKVIIVFLLSVTATFIPWAIFKAEYKFVQSVGYPGYKGIHWQIETSTESVINELKAAQEGNQYFPHPQPEK